MVLLGVLYMYMVSTDYSSSSQRRKAKSLNRRYEKNLVLKNNCCRISLMGHFCARDTNAGVDLIKKSSCDL